MSPNGWCRSAFRARPTPAGPGKTPTAPVPNDTPRTRFEGRFFKPSPLHARTDWQSVLPSARTRRAGGCRDSKGGFRLGKEGSGGWSKTGGQASAIDVEGLEDFQDRVGRYPPFLGPDDDVEVFLAFLETVEDSIEEERF